ncbi:MAG: ABC transporter permease [Devosia sp.]
MNAFVTLARRHLWLPPLLVLVVLGIAIGIMRPGTFAIDQINIKVAAAMTLILIATGETIVVSRGGIDLSVGGILSLTTAICATRGDPGLAESIFWIGFVLVLGALVGVLNSVIITIGKLQPFVVTLATWSILEGCALMVLPAESSGVPDSWVAVEHVTPLGIGVPIMLLGILVSLWAWFSRTRIYNAIRAAGSNERSAYLNRVSVLGTNAWAYGLSGFFAAAAGLYFSTQTGAGHPTVGTQYVLPAIAAVVIGGTSLLGGRGTLMGTIVGAFILTLIGDVVFLLKLQSYWQWVMSGFILMLVVILTGLTESRSSSGSGS